MFDPLLHDGQGLNGTSKGNPSTISIRPRLVIQDVQFSSTMPWSIMPTCTTRLTEKRARRYRPASSDPTVSHTRIVHSEFIHLYVHRRLQVM